MTPLLATALLWILLLPGDAQSRLYPSVEKLPPQCMDAAHDLLGRPALEQGKGVSPPRRVKGAYPNFNFLGLPPGREFRGAWVGEILIDTSGKVLHLWVLAEPDIRPPVPAVNHEIEDTVRHWQFAPSIVAGEAVPVCATVRIAVDYH